MEEAPLYLSKTHGLFSHKGLFINDVIIFGGYCDPPSPLPLVITRHFLATPPYHVTVARDKTDFATKQRMLGS